MALTGQDILNAVNKLALPQKIAVVAVVVVLVTAGNWYLLVDPKLTEIQQKQTQLRTLEDDLIQKQSIANNLAQFKHEKEVLERRLAQALTALPTLALLACGSPAPPPRKAAPPAPPPKPVSEEVEVPKMPTNIYVYSPIGKRDPFQNVITGQQGLGHISQPGRAKTALEKWPLDSLKLALTVTGTANPLAMVEDPDHRGWPV